MTEAENLRRMNTDRNRTDVENLFLKEMMEEDSDDLLNEEAEFDALIPGETDSLFDDTSSTDYQDYINTDDEDVMDGIADPLEDIDVF